MRSTGSTRQRLTPPEQKTPLGFQKLIAFVATREPTRAKAFYCDTLGLQLVSEDQFALVFDVVGTMLRVTTVKDVAAAQYTILGWQVEDIVRSVTDLQRAGVSFERYAGVTQDELGIWKSPIGARVAWFKDPDDNTLSITQF